MLSPLMWQGLKDPDVAEAVGALREQTLRHLLVAGAGAYFVWQFFATTEAAPEAAPRSWVVFPWAVACLLGTYLLQRRQSRLTVPYFLASAVVAVTAAVSLLDLPGAAVLYPVVTLAAVVLLHPLAGIVVAAGGVGLLLAVHGLGMAPSLDAARLVETAVGSAVTVVVAWLLGRSLVVAVEWSLQSYGEARRSAREAQEHRGRLVQALKQIDRAYYRLQQANAALELAWKAAEVAERARAEFVTNISHELRTPLNLIAGFSEMILASPRSYSAPLPADYRGDLTAIYRSAQHLLTLSNDVIDMARIGAGRLALAREPVDAAQVVRDACEMVREYLDAKGLWLRVEIAEDLPTLSIDRLRIRQVLLNLLTNAARFTERGGICVSVAHDGGLVTVRVADTGRGIAADALPKVFEEFYQADDERATDPARSSGFGLGLPISRHLVRIHAGDMGVESRPGAGTTFWFTLPVEAGAVASVGGERRLRGIPGSTAEHERVLVLASPEPELAAFLQRHLRGYRVVGVRSCSQARAAAAREHAVAIVADADLPPGEQLSRAPVPVLRLPLPHADRLASSLGAAAHLVKPVTRAVLERAIARLGREARTVLIVDDDADFVRLMTKLLRSELDLAEDDVLVAYSGRDALKLMEARRPDLVFLDVCMPDMAGTAVVRQMRRRPALAGIPIVVVSAHDQFQPHVALPGSVSVTAPGGFTFEELFGVAEALLRALNPADRLRAARSTRARSPVRPSPVPA